MALFMGNIVVLFMGNIVVLFNIQWNQWEYSGFNHGNIVVLFMGNIVEIQHSVEPMGIEWLIMGI